MAAKAEVTVTTGLPGSITGVSVHFQVGSVPYATVDLITEGGAVLFGSLEAQKRSPYNIDISCKVHAGQEEETRTLSFEGLLDGMSVSSTVGRSHFQAVLKGKAQTLLELTTLTPGLYPTSISLYKLPNFGISADDDGNIASWSIFDEEKELPYDEEPIVFYTELMKKLLKVQLGDFALLLGVEPLVDSSTPYEKIYTDGRYKKAAEAALQMFNNLDISAVTGGGSMAQASSPAIAKSLQDMFFKGPNVFLENYMHFLSQMGCSLIFGNTQMWVVPMNTVVKPNGGSPTGGGKLQYAPNAAGPADCIAYSYSDVGYRDIACVIVNAENLAGGADIGNPSYTRDHLAHWVEQEGLSKASGVLVVNNHPWMAAYPTTGEPGDAKETKQQLDQEESMYPENTGFEGGAALATGVAEETKKKKEDVADIVKDALENYAQTKFLQARYGDRQGSITMDFNPKWVPGTGGTLYIREISTTLSFYVTSVSHHIDVSPPFSGTAITTVNFSCGRSGTGPQGAKEDKFLGYNAGKESTVQEAFLSDIGASS
jgi:hypothetical protein